MGRAVQPFSPSAYRIVILPDGVFIAGGRADKPPVLLMLTLQMNGDVPSRSNSFYGSKYR